MRSNPFTEKPPEEDSEDLSDEEIAGSTDTSSSEGVVEGLKDLVCAVCHQALLLRKHELRRRAPSLYWRVRLACEQGHETGRLFRVSWLRF